MSLPLWVPFAPGEVEACAKDLANSLTRELGKRHENLHL
jgi:hypothetical protein